MAEVYIPSITDSRLNQLCRQIEPIADFVETPDPNDWSKRIYINGGGIHDFVWLPYARKLGLDTSDPQLMRLARPGHPRRTSFLGDPMPVDNAHNLVRVIDMVTYHRMSTFVNPSEAEVLAQIPEQLTDLVVAYQAHYEPDALRLVHQGLESYHAVLTRLFRRNEP